MRYANFLTTLLTKPVAITPEAHRFLIESAETLAGTKAMDLEALFDAPLPVYEEIGKVSVVNVSGVILPKASKFERLLGCVGMDEVRKAIKKAEKANTDSVVFRFDTPGGSVQGLQETAKAIQALGKSKVTYAYSDSLMCSAGMWLAGKCKNIFASESAEVGSIGIFVSFLTIEKQLKMSGIEPEVLKAGTWKAIGIACKDLTPEERAFIQAGVDSTYEAFKAALGGRKLQETTMQGQTFSGLDAVKLNLVDGNIADFETLLGFLNS